MMAAFHAAAFLTPRAAKARERARARGTHLVV
jgi:hypothetical protein